MKKYLYIIFAWALTMYGAQYELYIINRQIKYS